jgi:hypothetical protein
VLDIDLTPGGRLRYSSPDRKRVFVAGEVLEVDPPRLLKHTYIFAMKPEAPTVVTWELTEVPEGTRVTLTHAGWTDAHTAPEKHAAGWKEILGLLKSELETGDIPAQDEARILDAGPLHVGDAQDDQGLVRGRAGVVRRTSGTPGVPLHRPSTRGRGTAGRAPARAS